MYLWTIFLRIVLDYLIFHGYKESAILKKEVFTELLKFSKHFPLISINFAIKQQCTLLWKDMAYQYLTILKSYIILSPKSQKPCILGLMPQHYGLSTSWSHKLCLFQNLFSSQCLLVFHKNFMQKSNHSNLACFH